MLVIVIVSPATRARSAAVDVRTGLTLVVKAVTPVEPMERVIDPETLFEEITPAVPRTLTAEPTATFWGRLVTVIVSVRSEDWVQSADFRSTLFP